MKRVLANRRTILLAGVAALVVIGLILGALGPWRTKEHGSDRSPSVTPTAPATAGFGRALYSGAIFDRSGHLDINSTLTRVAEAHANTYYYLIWDRLPRTSIAVPKPSSGISDGLWKSLPAFAASAAKRHINVVVYLVPPSESVKNLYKPFGWDYPAWFTAIGKVASAHTNIRAIAIDDLAANLARPGLVATPSRPLFDAAALRNMRSNAKDNAPWISFLALMYGQDFFGPTRILPYLRSSVDGVIYAFAGPGQPDHRPQNSTDSSGLQVTGARVRALTNCGGQATCFQALFEPELHPVPSETVIAQSKVTIPTGAQTLKLSYADDRSPSTPARYGLTVALDGATLSARQRQNSRGMELDASIPANTRAGVHNVSIRVSRPALTRTVSVLLNSLSAVGRTNSVDLMKRTPAAWKLSSTAAAATLRRVPKLSMNLMYYCARFSRESTISGAADAPYVRAVLPQIENLISRKQVDGVVAYRLNLLSTRRSLLDGDPRNYGLVQQFYKTLADEH